MCSYECHHPPCQSFYHTWVITTVELLNAPKRANMRVIAASAELGPRGEDKSVADRLERMQKQRRALGKAIQHSASSRFPLNERSEESAAFFVETAASINTMRRSGSKESAIFDKDFVKQASCCATALGGHKLLMDRG